MLWRNLPLIQSAFDRQHRPIVLAVEDDEDNLLYITCALKLFDYNRILARDAVAGFFLAKKHQPDLILLDLKMPEISGFELIQMLKLDVSTTEIPVVAVTALASQKQKELIINSGFDDYLIKPYLLEDLEEIVCSNITAHSDR